MKVPGSLAVDVERYLGATLTLSNAEHGALLLLLLACACSDSGGISQEDRRLASVTRTSLSAWRSMRSALSPFFCQDPHLGWLPRAGLILASAAEVPRALESPAATADVSPDPWLGVLRNYLSLRSDKKPGDFIATQELISSALRADFEAAGGDFSRLSRCMDALGFDRSRESRGSRSRGYRLRDDVSQLTVTA
jgi:hypothetical protein